MSTDKVIRARAPAKIILSGEHAVVYGQPALAMAINRYTESRVSWSTPLHFTFNLLGLDFKQKMTLEALKRVKRTLRKQYQQFSQGALSIREVLKHPFELTLYTAINVLDKLKHNLPMGIDFDTKSTIPIGSGLGSSAACVVSLITALSAFLDAELSIEDYIRLGIESENLQHGFSSGLDVHISYLGGCLFYQNGIFKRRQAPQFPLQLVLTGRPSSTTGECIAEAKKIFTNSEIANDFAAVTTALDAAMQENDLPTFQTTIRQNHQLLKKIGVVPDKVSNFIQAIESMHGAAKISGSGSIKGDAAGAVLCVTEENLNSLCHTYGYELLTITGDQDGAKIL